MSNTSLLQASRLVLRAARPSSRTGTALLGLSSLRHGPPRLRPAARFFSVSPRPYKGIMPETEAPAKPHSAPTKTTYGVAELTDKEYHELADSYLDNLLSKIEHLQDTREDLDIEYSAGVMIINAVNKGTYVINKQPPNNQIWLSSPISGPKRYDWCIVGEGQYDKEGTGSGKWIYTRDSVSLNELILEELGVDLDS